ncbi:S1/P1 nuclease [Hahella ganghwensis]|uniref:S1/P1 nuclease n=1 Tax=Hahella ganghwensis TaxID=286420 RepID=UPI00037184B0|nr:S1/P1 nuclease [Hahella ganghwensis]
MKRVIFALTLLMWASQSFAWGEHSHRIICDIAWRNLDTNAKQEVRLLLRKSGHRTFAEACVWPDEIRDQPRYDFALPHHYMNVSRSSTEVEETEACRNEGCVLSAIHAYTNILQGVAVDGYHNNRAKALMFLGHFVGDIHQPLHVAYEDDRGGNKTIVTYGAKEYSLHFVWDVMVPEVGMPKNWRNAGEALSKQLTEQEIATWNASTPEDWANESLAITRQIYEETPALSSVSRDYIRNHHLQAEIRMQQAGIRLANLLNTIYK